MHKLMVHSGYHWYGLPGYVARELLVNAGPKGVQHGVVQVILRLPVAGMIYCRELIQVY